MTNKENEENNAVTYTKAGLMDKSNDYKDETEIDETEKQENAATENTPKISKSESTDHNNDRPLH